jgi:hypothetical protein
MGDVHKIPPPNGIYPQSLSSDDFHPEFGYLCPTPRMRLKLRVIAILASIGMTIGAISVLAPVHSEGDENDRRELALSAAVPTADEAPAMTLPSSTALMGASVALRAPTPCQELLGSLVNHQCETGRSRSARSTRGAPNGIASLPIGHSGAVSANELPVPEPNAVTSEKGKAVDNVTDVPKASAVGLVNSSASNTEPRTKRAHKHRQTTPPVDNGLSAFGAAPWFGSKAHNNGTPFGSGGWGAWR